MAADQETEFTGTGDAIGMLRSAMRYLAGVSYQDLPAEVIGGVLAAMEQVDAVQATVRGRAGDAFIDAQAHLEYGYKSLGAWYRNVTKVTGPAATAHKKWASRNGEHPLIMTALAAAGIISESWARQVMAWTSRLPGEFMQQADQIMIEAAENGVDLAGLARIAAELAALLAGPDIDEGTEPGRGLRLETTFDGAGLLDGDLTPECAAKVKAVLEPLAAAMNQPGDDRSYSEKMHDALEEAMTRLLAARLVPQSQGAPSTAIAHIHFGDLVAMDAGSKLLDRWKDDITPLWAAERAGASVQPGDGACWLTGDAARRFACDAMIVPVVTATLDTSHLSQLIQLCTRYHHAAEAELPDLDDLDDLIRRILGTVIAIASGAASYLRRNQFGQIGLGGPSLPLDVGQTGHIPAHIRRAVSIRDHGTCAFPGGCDAPAIWCDQHHAVHKSDGGATALGNIGIFCQFHHDYLIHKLGWSVAIEPDGTITARKPDGSIYMRSHPPPPRPRITAPSAPG